MATPIVWGDRIKTTQSGVVSGLDAYTLTRTPPAGFISFASGVGDGNRCVYQANDGTNWEINTGTFTLATNALTRDALIVSSLGTQAISWSSATPTVWVNFPADQVNMFAIGIQSGRQYVTNPWAALTTAAPTVGQINYAPVIINQWFSSFLIAADITTLSTNSQSTFALGLYDNLMGAPNNLLAQQAALAGSSQGGGAGQNQTTTLSLTSAYAPGIYWAAIVTTTASPTFEVTSAATGTLQYMGIASAVDTSGRPGWVQTSATLPPQAGSLSVGGANAPRMSILVAS